MQELAIKLDPTTLTTLQHIAAKSGSSPQQIVREAIKRDLFRRTRAKRAVRTDERLVAPLRALLADDLAFAQNWDDLQARLKAKGYALREAGGGLALVEAPTGKRVAKASELGYSYARLMRRFGRPFPGHSHRYLFDRLS